MSPTDAMLIRNERLSGSGGGAVVSGAAGADVTGATAPLCVGVSVPGADAQPANAVSTSKATVRKDLVTEPDAQHIDFRGAQTTTQHIEFTKVIDRADAHTVIRLVIDRDALDL